MTKLDPLATVATRLAVDELAARPKVLYQPDIAWKMEPVLELWVDVESNPVTIRLAGVLDHDTCASVVPIIEELLGEGYRAFGMQVDDLEPLDDAGFSSLAAIQRLATSAGATLEWSCWPEHQIGSDQNDLALKTG